MYPILYKVYIDPKKVHMVCKDLNMCIYICILV